MTLLDDEASRRAVTAERSFLTEINAGCHTPTGALAIIKATSVSLHARLFSEDHSRDVAGLESGTDPQAVGVALARRLIRELELLG